MAKGRGTTRKPGGVPATRQFHGIKISSEGRAQIETGNLVVPSSIYTANWVDVDATGYGGFTLLFGERIPRTTSLHTMLEVEYGRELRSETDWSSRNGRFRDQLREYVGEVTDQAPIDPRLLGNIPKFHHETATLETLAFAGDDAEICFYYLSPSAFGRIAKSKDVGGEPVRPVALVVLHSHLLLNLLDKVDDILNGKGGAS